MVSKVLLQGTACIMHSSGLITNAWLSSSPKVSPVFSRSLQVHRSGRGAIMVCSSMLQPVPACLCPAWLFPTHLHPRSFTTCAGGGGGRPHVP